MALIATPMGARTARRESQFAVINRWQQPLCSANSVGLQWAHCSMARASLGDARCALEGLVPTFTVSRVRCQGSSRDWYRLGRTRSCSLTPCKVALYSIGQGRLLCAGSLGVRSGFLTGPWRARDSSRLCAQPGRLKPCRKSLPGCGACVPRRSRPARAGGHQPSAEGHGRVRAASSG